MTASRWPVPPDADGRRVDRVLSEVLGEPRAESQRRLERGEVAIAGTAVGKSRRVRAGDVIMVDEPARPVPPPAPPAVSLRYEDDAVAVVAKPAGLVVHDGAGVTGATLVDALRAMGVALAAAGGPERPGIVHRLDRGTSGLLVVAKTGAALRALRSQFDAHTVGRRYWALVDGVPEVREAVVDAPIARHPQDRTRFWTAGDGREARSRYTVRAAYGTASRVEVHLATGRTHQVRVHMAALGHPVSGDRAYGASRRIAHDLDLQRPALHAEHLAFDHPVSGVRIALDEPIPPDLAQALARLDPTAHQV